VFLSSVSCGIVLHAEVAMKPKRRWLLAGCLFLGITGLLLTVPPIRNWIWYAPAGWLRGEAFYEGLPTSYWRDKLVADREWLVEPGGFPGNPKRPQRGPRAWYERLMTYLGMRAVPFQAARLRHRIPRDAEGLPWPVELIGQTAARPVLLELAHDRTAWIRCVAYRSLGHPATCEPEGLAALTAALDDPDAKVRGAALLTLYNLGPGAKEASPALRRHLNDPAWTCNLGSSSPAIGWIGARETLLAIDPELAKEAGIVSTAPALAFLCPISVP
jgi:hypothetical protein